VTGLINSFLTVIAEIGGQGVDGPPDNVTVAVEVLFAATVSLNGLPSA
jgi:hypothetical protein